MLRIYDMVSRSRGQQQVCTKRQACVLQQAIAVSAQCGIYERQPVPSLLPATMCQGTCVWRWTERVPALSLGAKIVQ